MSKPELIVPPAPGPDESFFQVPREMTRSLAFLSLSPGERAVLFEFLDTWNWQNHHIGKKPIIFSWTNSEMVVDRHTWGKYRGGILSKGFIEPACASGSGYYRTSEGWKNYRPSGDEARRRCSVLTRKDAEKARLLAVRKRATPYGQDLAAGPAAKISPQGPAAKISPQGPAARNSPQGPAAKNSPQIKKEKKINKKADTEKKRTVEVGGFASTKPGPKTFPVGSPLSGGGTASEAGLSPEETPGGGREKTVPNIPRSAGNGPGHGAWWGNALVPEQLAVGRTPQCEHGNNHAERRSSPEAVSEMLNSFKRGGRGAGNEELLKTVMKEGGDPPEYRAWWLTVINMLEAVGEVAVLESEMEYAAKCKDPKQRETKDLGKLDKPGAFIAAKCRDALAKYGKQLPPPPKVAPEKAR